MLKDPNNVNVKIPEDWRNGLRFAAYSNKPKLTMRSLLVNVLEKAGIKRMTKKELAEKLGGKRQ